MGRINVEGSKFKGVIGQSKFINLKLNGKTQSPELGVMINHWGVDKNDLKNSKVFSKIQEKSNHFNFSVKCSKPECLGWICGYPSIKLGEGIWYPKTKIILGKPKDYQKMKISGRFKFKTKGYGNFAFDVWLTKNEKGALEKGDVEVMFWLDQNFDLPYKKLGETKDFIVKYVKKDKNAGNTSGTHWFIFFPKKKSNNFEFDLLKLIDFCKKKVSKINNYYIRSIDLGTEFSKEVVLEAKLYELLFDFKLK